MSNNCPVEKWSPRGSGPPRHAQLPDGLWACLSHSHDLVIAGIANCPLGLDIERSNPRHRWRLDGLIESLPEAEVRDAIRASPDPLAAFYRAWTLHEAYYKLACLESSPPAHVLATRIASLFAQQRTSLDPGLGSDPEIHAQQHQDDGYTLSLCSRTTRLCIVTPLAASQPRLFSGAPLTLQLNAMPVAEPGAHAGRTLVKWEPAAL
ncbi:MAG: 4'-phosphopantetheinyl transferase family protein [Halomonas sp.]|uniref:4'-phosphopantetheinyl transferase family protein n=1 Tax=Halomonas sp. TaxID=1486246 RepID=UPI003F93628E